MADRYQELYRLSDMLYLEGSPIIIEAGALQKDNVTNKVLVQLKLRNISRRDIIACKAKIRAFEPGGKELDGILDYTYLDVNKETGEIFGVKNAIYLPNNNTRRFEAEITEVVFKDDSVWTSQDSEWIPIPRQKTIAEKLKDDDLIKQYEIEVGGNCIFYPEANNGLFMCTCGAMNVASSRCYKCGRNYTRLAEALDETTLKVKCAERLKKENEEREAAELLAIKKRREMLHDLKKILIISFPIATILIIIAELTPTVIKPAVSNAFAYHNASKLLDSGDYDGSKEAFQELGDYKDAGNMVLECDYLRADALYAEGNYEEAINIWNSIIEYSDSSFRIEEAESDWKESDYQNALELKAQEKYTEAIAVFSSLDGYGDSEKQIEECGELQTEADYQSAITSLSNGELQSALELFKSLSGYKDADELYISTAYAYGCQLMEESEYQDACSYFSIAEGYEDADDLWIEAKYSYGCQLMEEGSYQYAIKQFDACDGYKDVDEKKNEAKYKFVLSHKNNSNRDTYQYLKELVAENYSDSKSIYKDLYAWKAIVAVNTSENDTTTNKFSISKYKTIYVHVELTGGTPNESTNLKFSYKWPGGSTKYDSWDGAWYSGTSGSFYTWIENPAYGSTGTFSYTISTSDGTQLYSGTIDITN